MCMCMYLRTSKSEYIFAIWKIPHNNIGIILDFWIGVHVYMYMRRILRKSSGSISSLTMFMCVLLRCMRIIKILMSLSELFERFMSRIGSIVCWMTTRHRWIGDNYTHIYVYESYMYASIARQKKNELPRCTCKHVRIRKAWIATASSSINTHAHQCKYTHAINISGILHCDDVYSIMIWLHESVSTALTTMTAVNTSV